MMKKYVVTSVLVTSLFLVSSCNMDAGSGVDLTDVKDNQKKILKRLSAIEKNQLGIKNSISSISKSAKPANNKKQQPQADPNKVYDIAIGDSYVWGNKDAAVTIIEWTDFQWPYCARSISLVDDVLKKYPNDVKVVIKNFPLSFHKQAKKAAQYCLAAREQGKFKEMYRMIFDNYKNLKNNEDLPLEYAAELGLDKEKLKSDANSPKIIGLIDEEIKQMRTSGIPRLSVPKFLINGKEPQGRSLEAWSAIIDAELKKK